jgi:hypothetical protein
MLLPSTPFPTKAFDLFCISDKIRLRAAPSGRGFIKSLQQGAWS